MSMFGLMKTGSILSDILINIMHSTIINTQKIKKKVQAFSKTLFVSSLCTPSSLTGFAYISKSSEVVSIEGMQIITVWINKD